MCACAVFSSSFHQNERETAWVRKLIQSYRVHVKFYLDFSYSIFYRATGSFFLLQKFIHQLKQTEREKVSWQRIYLSGVYFPLCCFVHILPCQLKFCVVTGILNRLTYNMVESAFNAKERSGRVRVNKVLYIKNGSGCNLKCV